MYAKRKQAVKNWKELGVRISMLTSFKLAHTEDVSSLTNRKPWWESGAFVIIPDESKTILGWNIFKSSVIFVSICSYFYQMGFIFRFKENTVGTEIFFDVVQLCDSIVTFFVAINIHHVTLSKHDRMYIKKGSPWIIN